MSLQKRKVGTLVIASLLCGSMLTGCVSTNTKGVSTQALGRYTNTEGRDIDTYDIRAIERELASDKNMSTDKIDKYTESLLVEVYKELKKGLNKARQNYINERLLVVRELQGSDEEMKSNVVTLMKTIKKAFDNKISLGKSKFYDLYVLNRLEKLQSDPYDLLTQINDTDTSVKEAMIDSYDPRIKLDDKVKEDIVNYKHYAECQLAMIRNLLQDDNTSNVAKLKDTIITLKTNLALLDLSGNTKKFTEMYDNMMIDSLRKDVDKLDVFTNKLAILKDSKDKDKKVEGDIAKTEKQLENIKRELVNKLNMLKYEFEFDGRLHPEEDLKEVKEQKQEVK